PVGSQVDALVLLELRDHPVDDRLVEVVAAEMIVAVRGLTSKTPSPSSRTDTSKVPPPRSKTRIVWSVFSLSSPYASSAAVGSLMIRTTLSPAILPASFVASRCALLK